MTHLCSAILRVDSGTACYCIAEADASGRCPVHRERVAPSCSPLTSARSRPTRHADADVLPWANEDVALFAAQPRAALPQKRRHV